VRVYESNVLEGFAVFGLGRAAFGSFGQTRSKSRKEVCGVSKRRSKQTREIAHGARRLIFQSQSASKKQKTRIPCMR
jgi:hypothetical protein